MHPVSRPIAALGAALLSVRLLAAPTPIDAPSTLEVPGEYIVTANLDAGTGTVLSIRAADVSVDLDGHILRGNVVLAPSQNGPQRVTLKDGRIEGAVLRAPGAVASPALVRLEELSGLVGGIRLESCEQLWIHDARCDGPVVVNADPVPLVVGVSDSVFRQPLDLGGVVAGFVRSNGFRKPLTLRAGESSGSPPPTIERNALRDRLVLLPCASCFESAPSLLQDNLIRALDVMSDGNRIVGNSLRQGTITVAGSRNTIERNAAQGDGYGLVLRGDLNVYRDNVLHNNTLGAILDDGFGNVDAGGNVR